MGILEGAIIGGIAGGVAAFIMVARQRGGRKKVAAAIQRGDPQAARAAIDKAWPNRGKLGMQQIIPLLNRFTALGALGDLNALREEPAALASGGLSARVQVKGFALLARRLLGDPAPEILSELTALTEEIERDGGALLTLVRKGARTTLALARTVDGTPLTDEERKEVLKLAGAESAPGRPAFQLGLMYDRIASGKTQGIAQVIVEIERDWPRSAWSKRAEELLARHGAGAEAAARP
jgi:hypothetical protein